MAITNVVWVELDRAIYKELNDIKFYIIWSLLVSAIFQNVKWQKIVRDSIGENKEVLYLLYKESVQSLSWCKDRKQFEDNDNVQI